MARATATELAQFDGVLLDGLQFCTRVYALYESMAASPVFHSNVRRRRGAAKQLVEELLPIASYLQASYRLGRYIQVRWCGGSQTYDAELVQRGAFINDNCHPPKAFLEVTCAEHGNEHLMRERLDTDGGAFGVNGIRRVTVKGRDGKPEKRTKSEPASYSGDSFIREFTQIAIASIAQKEAKPYPDDTTLIVACHLNMLYLPDDWDELASRISCSLGISRFREIYLHSSQGMYGHSRLLIPKQCATDDALTA